MAAGFSRRRLAAYVAEQIAAGAEVSALLRQVAAYLIETRATRDVDVVAATIEEALAERGIVVAEVTTAHALSAALQKQLKTEVMALATAPVQSVQLRQVVDPSVIGGVKIALPGQHYDGTIQHKLTALAGTK
jgi:ATP synthase F1, delta subunit